MHRFFLVGMVLGLSLAVMSPLAFSMVTGTNVTYLVPVPADKEYSDAAAPAALNWVCAQDQETLERYFKAKQSPFENNLVRSISSDRCHILYQPSLSEFRASPDNRPVKELFFNIDSLAFVARQVADFGDALSILKSILPHINRPVDIQIGVRKYHGAELIEAATSFHFGNTIHNIQLRESHVDGSSVFKGETWPQDYLKSGYVYGTKSQILITRRLYEGKVLTGKQTEHLLESFAEARFARSQLSWEGGDLQLVQSPREPSKTVLFYGNSAKDYWGKELNQQEYAHVLGREFGADLLVDVSGLVSHVDYLLSFLPEENIVLVSVPITGNRKVACAALKYVLNYIGKGSPEPVQIKKLGVMSCESGNDGSSLLESALSEQAALAKGEFERHKLDWINQFPRKKDWQPRLIAYLRPKCGEDIACMQKFLVSTTGQGQLIQDEPELARIWVEENIIGNFHQNVFSGYANLFFSQFDLKSATERLRAKIHEIQQLGFRVVEVPHLAFSGAGVSYTNNLLIDHTLILPRVGLGDIEEEFFMSLRQALPSSYQVVSVNAQYSLTQDGAVHCRTGIVRER